MANPYTTMRQNIEYALENHSGLKTLGVVVRKWGDARGQQVQRPADDRMTWLRCETVSIAPDPFWSNGMARTVHKLDLVAALPVHKGLKQEDIEELCYQILRALAAMTRGTMHTTVSSLEKLTFVGGSIALAESAQARKDDALSNLAWSQVASIEVTYDETIASLTT